MVSQAAVADLQAELTTRFGVEPLAVRGVVAPYRICPLGAHIDHQLGRVTAMAIDRGVLLVYAPATGAEATMASRDFPGVVHFSFDNVPDRQAGDWGNFLRGAVRALQQHHALRTGIVGITQGSTSEGGLSSSAAVGVAYLLALEDVNRLAVTAEENILLDQYIENSYLGLRNGVLDQSAILLSRRDHLTVLDCDTLQHQRLSAPASMPSWSILIAASGIRQALVRTDYNQRVAECAEAARQLLAAAGRWHEPPLLAKVSADEYACHGGRLTGAPARRAAHFFSEMERVQRGTRAWLAGNMAEFGSLVSESGESSIANYECGAPPLIDLFRLLVSAPGVYGARFSGAGFRGCCLALVESERAEEIAAHVSEAYGRLHPELAPAAGVFLTQSADGAAVLKGAA